MPEKNDLRSEIVLLKVRKSAFFDSRGRVQVLLPPVCRKGWPEDHKGSYEQPLLEANNLF